jgi:hypothetical protein
MRLTLFDIFCYPKKRSTLSRKAEPPTAGLGRRRVWQALCILAFTCLLNDYSVAKENYKPIHYKQYILITLNDLDETYCLIELYSKENSKWDYKARNGQHIGIPQGKSKYLATVDGTKQIDWGIKYNLNRYGSMCKALNHFKKWNWH